jgi:hypothetical protein
MGVSVSAPSACDVPNSIANGEDSTTSTNINGMDKAINIFFFSSLSVNTFCATVRIALIVAGSSAISNTSYIKKAHAVACAIKIIFFSSIFSFSNL